MKNKQLGLMIFGLAIFVAILVISFFFSTNAAMQVSGCELDGCAAHQALPYQTVFGLIAAGLLAVIGLLLVTQEKEVVKDKQEAVESGKDEAVLSVLTDDERKIVEAVKKEPGVTQSTLRFKTDFSKAKLSGLLSELEKRHVVKKQSEGKSNKVFLQE